MAVGFDKVFPDWKGEFLDKDHTAENFLVALASNDLGSQPPGVVAGALEALGQVVSNIVFTPQQMGVVHTLLETVTGSTFAQEDRLADELKTASAEIKNPDPGQRAAFKATVTTEMAKVPEMWIIAGGGGISATKQKAINDANAAVTRAQTAVTAAQQASANARQSATNAAQSSTQAQGLFVQFAKKNPEASKVELDKAIDAANQAETEANDAEKAHKNAQTALVAAQQQVGVASNAATDDAKATAAATAAAGYAAAAETEQTNAEAAAGRAKTHQANAATALQAVQKQVGSGGKKDKALEDAQDALDDPNHTITTLKTALATFLAAKASATDADTANMRGKLEKRIAELEKKVQDYVAMANGVTAIAKDKKSKPSRFVQKTLESIYTAFPEIKRIEDSGTTAENAAAVAMNATKEWLKSQFPDNKKKCEKLDHIVKFAAWNQNLDTIWAIVCANARATILATVTEPEYKTEKDALLAVDADLNVVGDCEALRKARNRRYGGVAGGGGAGIPDKLLDRLEQLASADSGDFSSDSAKIEFGIKTLKEHGQLPDNIERLFGPVQFMADLPNPRDSSTFEDIILFYVASFLCTKLLADWAQNQNDLDNISDFDRAEIHTVDEKFWKNFGKRATIADNWNKPYKTGPEMTTSIEQRRTEFNQRRRAQRNGQLTRPERNALQIADWLLKILEPLV